MGKRTCRVKYEVAKGKNNDYGQELDFEDYAEEECPNVDV